MAGLLKAASKLSKAKELAKRIARDKAIKKKKTGDNKLTQKGLKLSKNKDIKMPERDIETPTIVGNVGTTARGEKINVGKDMDITRTKGGSEHAKRKVILQTKKDKGTATRSELNELSRRRAGDVTASRKQGGGTRGKTGNAKSDDPFFIALNEAKKDGVLGTAYDKLLPNQQKQIEEAARAFKKSEFRKDAEAALATSRSAPKSTGSAVANKRNIGENDYRKGGYVLSTIDNRKGKK